MLFPAGLREGTGALVGTKQVVGQEAQEGECRGHPGTQGSQACSCGSTGEPALVVTGLSFISGVEQVFMQESDTSNFLKKHGKRSPKSREQAASIRTIDLVSGEITLPLLSNILQVNLVWKDSQV